MEREPTGEAIGIIEQQDRPPFVIRAHHILNIKYFLRREKSAIDRTREYYVGAVEQRAFGLSKSYYDDVLGSTQEQADKYIKYKKEFYEEFLQLPPDYPVKIAEGQKDKICNGCAIGKHCMREKNPSDRQYIRFFRKATKRLGLDDNIAVIEETIIGNNAKPRKATSILTTAGTVKKVISSMPISFWSRVLLGWD